MKRLMMSIALLSVMAAAVAQVPTTHMTAARKASMHRFLIERTLPAGALAGLDAETKAKVNANNATVGVHWLQSYANADKTKTYCI